METEEGRRRFTEFWGVYVSAHNPQPNREFNHEFANPLITDYINAERPTFAALARVINRVQRHKCTTTYCQRRKWLANRTLSAEKSCRFYFPRELHHQAMVTERLNSTFWVFDGGRNDPFVNNYNRTTALGWLANTDISPCTSRQAVLRYIAKYCSKAETKSLSYQELAKEVLPRVTSQQPIVSLVSKFMNQLIAERDWTAQEVCYHLLHLLLQQGTCKVRLVDCCPPTEGFSEAGIAVGPENEITEVVSTYKRYLRRDQSLWGDLSYFAFLTTINWSRPQWSRLRNPCVLNYFPRYKPLGDSYNDFCRVKLTLNHPHQRYEDLLTVEGVQFDSYTDAYARCCQLHDRHGDQDYYGDVVTEAQPDEFEEEYHDEETALGEWEDLARELPNKPLETEDVDLLGNRNLDLAYDWTPHVGKFDYLLTGVDRFWKDQAAEYGGPSEAEEFSGNAANRLNA
jgi:hypothetical protein